MSSYPSPREPASSARRTSQSDRRNSHTRRHSTTQTQPPTEGRRRRTSSGAADRAADRPRRTSSSRRDRDRDGYRDLHSATRRRRSSAHTEKPKISFEPDVHVRAVPPSPYAAQSDRDPILGPASPSRNMPDDDLRRKRSLVRPERRRPDPNDPDYYYRKHAQRMNVMPSTTGADPQLEADGDSDSPTLKNGSTGDASPSHQQRVPLRANTTATRSASRRQPNKLTRAPTAKKSRTREAEEARKQRIYEASGTPSLWGAYCFLITIWAPNIVLRCFGKKTKEQQRAWREKIALISLILLVMLFVGFLTFGFVETVCPQGGPLRLRINHVGDGYMIFNGKAYNLEKSSHPAARGIAAGTNILYGGSMPGAGKDGSFLFQNVNGACKGLITLADGSDVPTNDDGDLAWYFPCNLYNQDGTPRQANLTIPYYLGYACHTAKNAREQFYNLHSSGDVYFQWSDVKNTSRNLIVYSGDVLDLHLLTWFNTSQVTVPDKFAQIREDSSLKGTDVTLSFSGENKQIAECFQDIIKVGSIDTDTVGCIASKVVLYVSLTFILSIVLIKFVLAVAFQWVLCRKYEANKTSMTGNKKKRNQQIEDWTEDIYRPPPKITDPASASGGGSDRGMRRTSFLPTTSRFTSPYAIEKMSNKTRAPPTTMVSQHSQQSTARLLPSSTSSAAMYGHTNRSEGTLAYTDGAKPSTADGRASLMDSHQFSNMHPDTEASGPQGFVHEAVVPQPPPEWQPFGFPLAHTICLVTAYSEGPEGLRTTLDSIAMTDYPNSHKLIYVVCDGLVKGRGETLSTPDVCIGMMKDFAVLADEVPAYSYVAVASGSKRHNMAKVYCGFYDYGPDSIIPAARQQRVPMMVVVKCGTPAEAKTGKPGNRGKRDSQIILMSFLQKVMFDERMTELEYEMFNGIWKLTGISPDFYEVVLMVDADTKVFPDSLTHMVSAMVKDPEIMGLCGETKIANKSESWVTMIQVFEYFISHHLSKSFESVFGGVTCLPGCFCMYRIKAPKGGQNYWVPVLANPDIVEHYSENVVDTLHKKNLLLLGEDRYLTSLMLKTFPKRKQMFIPQAVCKTTVPAQFKVLLSQRRRWINSTVHNLMELILVRDLCGTFCFSMQFVLFIELVGTLVLPAAIAFTIYVVSLGIKAAVTHTAAPLIPLILLALILGLPGVLIVITAHRLSYVAWMLIYLLSLPIWNFVLPVYAYWHFDDFSWGDTRQAAGETKGADKSGHGGDGEFDSSKITMKRWGDFEQERRLRGPQWTAGGETRPWSSFGDPRGSPASYAGTGNTVGGLGHERRVSGLVL